MQTKKYIMNALTQKKKLIILTCFTILVSTISFILAPVFLGNVIDKLILNENAALWIASLCFVILLWLTTEYFKVKQFFIIENYIASTLQKEAYSSALNADLNEFNKISSSEIARRINCDCKFIADDYIIKNIAGFITDVTYLVTMFVAFMLVSPILGFICIAGVPVLYLVTIGLKKLYVSNNKEVDKAESESSRVVEENLDKIKDVKIKNGVSKETTDYSNWFETNYKKNYFKWILGNFNSRLSFVYVVALVTLITTVIGLSLSQQIGVTLGKALTAGIFVPTVFSSIARIMNYKIKFSNIEKQVMNLDEIYSMRSEVRSEPINQLDEIFGVKLTDVCFDEENIGTLSNISFSLKNNESLGILSLDDNSGNILYDLLTKIKKPKSGSITINNCESGKINTFYLREIITAVSDKSTLFNDTMMSNITYPLPFDEYKYNDCLYKAKLKDVIFDLENKDNTMVNELPQSVLQQVALANAFYKDSKIFIFNNVTSSLDVKVEEDILKEIYKLKNKIIIIMSDRAFNLMNCTKIMITEKGKVIEYGLTQELLNNKDSIFCHSLRKIKLAKVKVS